MKWVNGAFPLAFWEAFDMILLPLKLPLAFLFGEVIRFVVVTSCKKAFRTMYPQSSKTIAGYLLEKLNIIFHT